MGDGMLLGVLPALASSRLWTFYRGPTFSAQFSGRFVPALLLNPFNLSSMG